MAKRPPPVEEPPDESWMATFADAITLLMAFFVMLLTFADYDIPAFDEAAAAIAERVGGEPQVSPTQALMEQIEDVVYEMLGEISLILSSYGYKIKDTKQFKNELASYIYSESR